MWYRLAEEVDAVGPSPQDQSAAFGPVVVDGRPLHDNPPLAEVDTENFGGIIKGLIFELTHLEVPFREGYHARMS